MLYFCKIPTRKVLTWDEVFSTSRELQQDIWKVRRLLSLAEAFFFLYFTEVAIHEATWQFPKNMTERLHFI